ncbi:MAG: class I mannose-6-phosphate isomerase [Bacteroidales bacterium]|nr:class I mannose-6-phosphate isomerase [Bacteroidales bacterium]
MNKMWYPLKFKPILHIKLWGGLNLKKFCNKPIKGKKVGESWELSTIENNISIVKNGSLKGKTLTELLNLYPYEILGKNFVKYKEKFPLLIKFIDASENLSIQVHPNDSYAQLKHKQNGKNEMWYIVNAEKDSYIVAGFNRKLSKDEFLEHLKNNSIEKILNKIYVKKGDVIYIPAGTIHSIGKGIVLAEIQQASDITYRVYDYNRKDENGNLRPLHIEDAINVLDFDSINIQPITYEIKDEGSTKILRCPYFSVNLISCIIGSSYYYKNEDNNFKIIMIINGYGTIENEQFQKIEYAAGDTFLIPAAIEHFKINSKLKSDILEIFSE